MLESAEKTYATEISFSRINDPGFPDLARSYNVMGSKSKEDIILFVHDDVVFLEKGWDVKIIEALSRYEVAGVCGAIDYKGGRIFDCGKDGWAGKIAGVVDGKEVVKVFKEVDGLVPADAVDGCFMAVKASHFNKFDEQFDGIFFYDIDYCLRSKCCIVDLLISHNKPEKYYGKYPADIKLIGEYWDKFHSKHGLTPSPIGNQVCKAMLLKEYQCRQLLNV